MAISYVGGVAGGRAGATTTTTQSINGTLTGGSASSPSQGDLIVVWCSAGTDGTAAAPNQFVSGNTSGAYQTETMQSITTVTYDTYAALNWQFAGVTPDTTITIPSSGNARNAQRWAIHVFRGVDSTTPWDVTSATASGTATGRPNPPSNTPSTSGAWILWLGASAAATGTAYTAPTDFSTNWLGGTQVDTADVMDGFGYYTGWTTGAYDPAAITAGGTTGANDSWVAKTSVLRPQAAVTHATTGALTGPGSTVAGTAQHNIPHPTSGALAGPGAVIVGSADRTGGVVSHATTGALTGPGSTVAGSAARTRAHPSTGALTGPGATVAGTAARTRAHPATGALTGPGAAIVGSAARTGAPVTHATTGALSGPGAAVAGAAARAHEHPSSGAIVGPGAALAGSAARTGAPVTHDTSGAIVGPGPAVNGQAQNGIPPEPETNRGGGIGRHWKKRELRARDERLAEYNRDKAELRRLIEQAIDPVQEGEQVAVVTSSDKQAVSIVRKSGPPVAIPAIKFDARQVSVEIGRALAAANIETKRLRDAETRQIAESAARAAVENMRIRMRRRRDEELLLLM